MDAVARAGVSSATELLPRGGERTVVGLARREGRRDRRVASATFATLPREPKVKARRMRRAASEARLVGAEDSGIELGGGHAHSLSRRARARARAHVRAPDTLPLERQGAVRSTASRSDWGRAPRQRRGGEPRKEG